MNRRSLLGALAGGLAAAFGSRPRAAAAGAAPVRHVTFLKSAATGKSELAFHLPSRTGGAALGAVATSDPLDAILRARRASVGARAAIPAAAAETVPPACETDRAFAAPPTAPAEPPPAWPGHAAIIAATAVLPPLAQVERLVELHAASGDGAPAFAASLIGELVLTRVRLAAADPRRLATLRAELP